MIAIDLIKQQVLDTDPKAIQDFSQGTVKVLWMCSTILFCSNKILI